MPHKDPEDRATYDKLWRKRNPEYLEKYNHSFRGRYTQLKAHAKLKSRVMELTLEDYTELVKANECAYCKAPLCKRGYGLDRVDNRLGYTKDNCVPCCGTKEGMRRKSCNFRKGTFEAMGFSHPRTVELLLELLRKDENVRSNSAAA